jgi:hypothetical protein
LIILFLNTISIYRTMASDCNHDFAPNTNETTTPVVPSQEQPRRYISRSLRPARPPVALPPLPPRPAHFQRPADSFPREDLNATIKLPLHAAERKSLAEKVASNPPKALKPSNLAWHIKKGSTTTGVTKLKSRPMSQPLQGKTSPVQTKKPQPPVPVPAAPAPASAPKPKPTPDSDQTSDLPPWYNWSFNTAIDWDHWGHSKMEYFRD